jgi:hypothetical protein
MSRRFDVRYTRFGSVIEKVSLALPSTPFSIGALEDGHHLHYDDRQPLEDLESRR